VTLTECELVEYGKIKNDVTLTEGRKLCRVRMQWNSQLL